MRHLIRPRLFWTALQRVVETAAASSRTANAVCEFLDREERSPFDHVDLDTRNTVLVLSTLSAMRLHNTE